ncbi:hypothetical protein D3C86_1285050 [compost metagenome]
MTEEVHDRNPVFDSLCNRSDYIRIKRITGRFEIIGHFSGKYRVFNNVLHIVHEALEETLLLCIGSSYEMK